MFVKNYEIENRIIKIVKVDVNFIDVDSLSLNL